MFLFAFAALGAQAAAGTVSVSYELNGETVSFSGATLREVNDKMRTYWEVNGAGCAYNAEKLPADGTGTLTWTVSGTVEQGDYLNEGALVLPSLSGGYIYRDGTYRWKKIEVKAAAPGATINSNPTFDVWHSYFSMGTDTTTVTGVTLQGGLYVVPHGTVTFDGCTFTGQLRVPNGDGAFAVTGCTFTGTTAAQDSNGYVMHYQAAGKLAFTGNTVADGYRRGLNIDNEDLTATVERNKLGTTADAGRSAIQISTCVKLAVTGNEIKLNGGNAFTFHEALLGLSAAPEVSISGNTVTGTGYLVYDDAVASGKAFTSDNLKLTYAADNVVAATVDTTQGVKGTTKHKLSGTVATTLHSVDFAAFVKALTDAGYTFDGSTHALAQNGKLTVKWSPKSGCYDNRGEGHDCTVGNVTATANTPKRVNSGLTQFQLFEGESHAVNVKNVAFVYEPVAFTVCENSDWKGTFTAEQAPAGQIYLMNTGDVTFEGCTFDKVVLTSFNCTGTSTVKDCSFKNVYNSYAVKDIRGATISVTGCTFENCGAAVMVSMVSSTVKVGAVTISGNTFKNVDVAGTAPDDKVGTRGLVQIASSGDYAGTAFDFSDNTATDCGPVLRQLNTTVSFGTEEKAQLNTLASAGGSLYTTDSIKRVVAKVGETAYETLDEAIKAVRDGETIVVNAGEYKLNGSLTYTGKAFTIQAAEGAKVSFDMSGAVALHGAKITFAGVTFDYKTNGNYIGLQHADTLVYNDCTINGMVFLYAASETFNRCTFNQTSAGAYNVWTYGAKEVAFNVCTFNCVGKSVLVYNEGANTKTDLAVSDCEFKASAPVEGKAAIEIDTSLMAGGATITVDAKTTAEGFAEGSNSKSTLWNDKKQTQDTNRNTTVTVAGETVFTPVVAQVGTAGYTTLAAAFAALSAENHTLALLNEGAWDAATPVYWAAGAQNGYVATFTAALTAAYKANAGAITIVCRPGADVGEMTHGHVADDLTIYGNDAFISDGECDLEVDTYTFSRATGAQAADGAYLEKDIAITAYELDNLGVWGERHTAHMVTVNLTDCDGKALEGKTNVQRVYISGTTGVNNITLTGCDFLTKATAVYSNADGAITAVNCSFTGGQVPFNINHKANGTQTVAVENCTFTNCGDAGDWKQFAAPLRLVNSGAGTQSAEVTGCAFAGTVGTNGDILLGDGRTGQASNDVELKVVNTAANIQAQKPGYYGGETVDATKMNTAASPAEGTLETSVAKLLPVNDGSEAHPYSREQFAAMTRAEYREAQERLGGTLYVNVGNYAYEKNGVLGNGVRDDTTGQVPDHSKLNAYGENGYLGEKNDGANGHAVVFVGGTITSGVTGYTSIDNIGTSLLLAVPAYTKVTFKKTTFKNVLSFDYQLYTSPWSQLGGLTFNGCTFDGIIVGAIAAQELAFNGCTFNNYVNTTSANNSNPTWIRPAYGNWTKGDNEGQGTDFRSLTKITFENNTVTSTRPVKFERIAQWEMATTVTATNNTFAITPQEGDKEEKKTKNVGLYFGANAKFDLVIEKNKKSNETAALYTAEYLAPTKVTYVGLPAGSTVKNTAGEEVATGDGDALAWKTTKKITLKTTTEVASVTNAEGVSVNFATLADAIAAAQAGETVTLLTDVESVSVTTVVAGKDIVLDLNGKTLTSTANGITIEATAKLTVKDSLTGGKVVATGKYSNAIENKGTLVIESGSFEAVYGAICALGGSTTTISGGTFASSAGHYGMYYWANGTALSVTVNGGLFKNSVSTAMENGKVALSIKGGSFATDLTDYCGADAGTYLDKETGLYVYGRESEHVPAGYVVDENGNVTISDEESLFWFAQQVNVRGNTFKGKTVSLADDIALTAKWTPVGVSVAKSFQGTFDGKGHAITGMKVSGAYQAYGYGFFKLVISATVKNVTFTQAEVKGEYSNVVGCVAGYSYGSSTFENVHVTNSLVYAFGKVGGFVGMAEDAGATTTFRNCSVEATTIHGGYNVAGFCGLVMGTCAFSGSSLTDVTPVVDEDSQGFGKVVELDTTVVCDGSVATCAGKGTSIKGRYIPRSGYYWSAYSDLYNHYGDSKHDCTLADGKKLANSEVVHDASVAIGDARYSDLQAAFDAAKTGDTVTLLSDTTLTEQVNITKALDGLTLDGNGKTITCATTDDPFKSGGSALYFGNANDHLYCTGIKIKNLTMTGTARFAIFLCGGTATEFTNVKISGNYYIAVNLYGTHGATMTNCDISNSTKGTDKYISAIWSNVASANPLTLNNSKVDVIAINTYTTANKLEPKIFVMDGSEVGEIHTFDDGSVSGNKKLCVSDGSTGSYVVKEYDEATSTWVNLRVAQIGTVGYETLEAALAAAKDGETVKLLADITLASKQSIRKELTLDLNGKTLTGTAYQTLSLGSGANVTIQDSSAEKTGKVANGYKGRADPYTICLDGYSAAALTLVSGTVEANPHKTDLQSVAINTNHEKDGPYAINIKGGKVFVPESSTNGRAIVAGKNVTLTVEGGEIVGGLHGVDVYDDSKTAITGGSISARVVDTGVIKAAYGLRAIGTASVTIGAADGTADVVSVAGIKMDDDGYKLDVPAVTVNSGTIAGPVYSITKGTIVFNVQATSEDVLRFADDTAAKFLPSNLELRAKDIDGKTMYYVAAKPVAAIGAIGYETLEAALAAAKDGETVKLLADVTESVTIAADRTLTLDLNGKTLSAGKASEALTVTGHLTIDDTSAAKSGRVVGDGRYAVYMNNRTAHVGEAAVGGSLTLNAGSLEGATYGVYIRANQAAFTMNGGKVSATQAESIRVNNDYHAKTISLLSGEVGDVFLGSDSNTELTTLTVGTADQTDPAAVKVGKIGLQFNTGLFKLELYNGLVGELPEIGSCTATYTALGMLVKSNANCPSGKVFEAIAYNGETWYRIAALQKIAITFDGSKTVALPFATDWLKEHVGKGEASWTTAALEEKAENGLAKWQCYLFGLDPNKKDAKVVATAGQGTDEAIPLTVANADASASSLVKGGYVTVAYVLMGSNDGTAWTQVATSNKRDGLAIPLTGTTYKFYRVDVTVTSAEGN